MQTLSSHSDCSHQYGAPGEALAFITTATFEVCGVTHRAVRFWRSDYLATGKIEVYTLEPKDPESTSTELGWLTFCQGDFLRYVDEAQPTRTDVAAMRAIAAASKGTYTSVHADMAERFAGMEMA